MDESTALPGLPVSVTGRIRKARDTLSGYAAGVARKQKERDRAEEALRAAQNALWAEQERAEKKRAECLQALQKRLLAEGLPPVQMLRAALEFSGIPPERWDEILVLGGKVFQAEVGAPYLWQNRQSPRYHKEVGHTYHWVGGRLVAPPSVQLACTASATGDVNPLDWYVVLEYDRERSDSETFSRCFRLDVLHLIDLQDVSGLEAMVRRIVEKYALNSPERYGIEMAAIDAGLDVSWLDAVCCSASVPK